MITSKDLRKKYLDYFESKGHAAVASASLLPENDPTVLFTTAGMHPLVPYLLGEPHPLGKRLVNVQKCIRTGDIDEVGDAWHLSFFEMLGNWSLGDYFKKGAIEMSFEFLTDKKYLGIPTERLSVTCFAGDKDCPKDAEAAAAWESLGIPKNRIHFLPKADNWWGPAGATGPCGPDTEMFFHVKDLQEKSTEEFVNLQKKGDFCEIWNDVLMQYNKNTEGKYLESKQKNIDTGMGLERTIAVLNGYDNAYECDTLKPIIARVAKLAGKKDSREFDSVQIKSARVITDHLRAATMVLGDSKGIVPSNVDQGYVLRRFIRRSVRHARLLGINGNFCKAVAEVAVKVMGEVYPEVEKNKVRVLEELEKEEEKFQTALEKGLTVAAKLFEKKNPIAQKKFVTMMASTNKRDFFVSYLERKFEQNNKYGVSKEELDAALISGKEAFDLFQSYGFPLEMIDEIATEARLIVDHFGFRKELERHQELSRKGAEQKFKGGLADAGVATTKLHTATHLLNQALREVLGRPDIHQKGSNISAERARFDFNADEKLTDEQVARVEKWVNDCIKAEAEVVMEIMPIDEAKKSGAQGVFDSKYGEKVKVYTIKKGAKVYSKEICGGPHVTNTKELGHFKISKQEAVAAGVRRIKAILE